MKMKLNEHQEKAADHFDGPCLVTSCPGSGKTFTLVERIVRLIDKGVRPQNILCITFTNKAAAEMKERICKRLGVKTPGFFIGTFHSLCANVLRKMGHLGGYPSDFTIIDDKEQFNVVMQIARKMGREVDKPEVYNILKFLNHYRDQQGDFSYVEDRLVHDYQIDIARRYLEKCKESHLVDFSALIYDAIQLIEDCDEIRDKLQNGFKYILVDETQDTNNSQYHLVNLLGAKWNNIMLIGDLDQSIYLFRGARYKNLQNFIKKHDNCTVIPLSKNYRSTPEIIGAADKLIKHNSSHMGGKFETDNPSGEPVRCFQKSNQISEANWVGDQIRRLKEEGGWDGDDIAVLYRMNKMSEPIEQSLAARGIPYEVIGNFSFYDRKEVKDVIAMIKFLINKRDGIAFHRICSILPGMGDVTVGKIENRAEEQGITILQAANDILEGCRSVKVKNACRKIVEVYGSEYDHSKPAQSIMSLVEQFNYSDYLEKYYPKNAIERKDNVSQIVESASSYNDFSDGIEKYLQQISLVSHSDKEVEGKKVSLMSLHAAKGLEYPVIFMIGVEESILPHGRAISENPEEGLEEERRLAYVGMTRAKKVLYITYCSSRFGFGKFGNKNQRKVIPSRFLTEAGLIDEQRDRTKIYY
jgi:DNA helicase-2/ATP-dependent DNA helicase PcrA